MAGVFAGVSANHQRRRCEMIKKTTIHIQCDACGYSEDLDLDLETSEKWHATHRITDQGTKENIQHFCDPCFAKVRRIWDQVWESTLKNLAKLARDYK